MGDLSIACSPGDAGRAMYVLAGPAKEMNMDMVKSLSDYVRELAPTAVIRGGDFPGEKHFIDVTLMLSQLSFVPKIREYYERATTWSQDHKGQIEEIKKRIDSLADVGKDLPSLL